MRLWSLHPKYLDAKGLVVLWRETLLAKHVLQGKTKGYKNHPQLCRFKKLNKSVETIDQYLDSILKEAIQRGYNFDATKISRPFKKIKIKVTEGQIKFETEHLLKKLKARDNLRYKQFKTIVNAEPHPMFRIVKGEIENWEIV